MLKRFILFTLCTLLFTAGDLLMAQATGGTILGAAADQSGALLPGATITATHTDTGLVRTVVTDERGRYRLSQLPLGNWTVKAEHPGFAAEIRSGITLTIGQEAVIDFGLRVGDVTEAVTVTGEAPLIETTTSELGALVEERTVRELPLNGRSFEQLATLQAGVVSIPFVRKSENVGNATILSVAGGRTDTNTFVLDGTDIVDFGQTTPGSSAGTMLGVEGIREFKVLTHNFSAEYGRSGGAVINVVTKSGTNELHGSVFYFHRNSFFDARNFFDLVEPPPFKRNQFGATLGGPIKQDKTFFFANYEGLRERLGLTLRSAVPNADAHKGLLPDRTNPGVLNNVGVHPRVAPYLELYPLPNGRDLGDGSGELIFAFSQPTDENFVTGRIDQRISDTDTVYVRYTFDQSEVTPPRPLPLFREIRRSRTQSATLEETKILTSRQINTLRFGFSRGNPGVLPVATQDLNPSLSFVPGEFIGIIRFTETTAASAGVGGIAEFGPSNRAGGNPISNSYQVKDDYQATFGRHSIRTGVNISRYQFNQLLPLQSGAWAFPDLASFLTNRPAVGSGPGGDRNRVQGTRQWLFGFYLQDDLGWTPRLTLNLGLRYEYFPDTSEVNGRFGNLLRITDSAPTPGVWTPDAKRKTIQPRVGLAWQVRPAFVVRAGVGIFHNQPIGRIFGNVISGNVRGSDGSQRNPTSFPDASGFTAAGLKGMDHFPPDFKTPTMYHYHLDLQFEPLPRTMLRASYVGSHGSHLWVAHERNGAVYVLQDGKKFFPAGAPRRNPNFQTINSREAVGNSFYNSVALELQRRFQAGLQFRASYTLAKGTDDASAIAGADALNSPRLLQDSDDRRADRGLSSYDLRHRFVANWVFEPAWRASGKRGLLLNSWQLNGIVTLSSGFPMTPLVGFNQSRSLGTADRPNLVSGRSNNSILGIVERYFDPTAFQLPPAGFLGNAGRNTVILPGLATLDLNLAKRFTLRENLSLQIRAEAFNLFNHTNLGLPASAVFNRDGSVRGTAGQIIDTTTSSRQFQFGMKILF